jgi:hypothetical protein
VATAAVVLIAVAIGPGGFLQAPNGGPGGPTTSEPSASGATPTPPAFSRPTTIPPLDDPALTELGSIQLGGDEPFPVIGPLPAGTDVVRIYLDCTGGEVTVQTYTTITGRCRSSWTNILDIVPDDPDHLDISISAGAGVVGTAVVAAFDRDVPADGFVPPRIQVSAQDGAAVEAVRGCGLRHNARYRDDPCSDTAPTIPESQVVTVVSRDPLSIEWPAGWEMREIRFGWTPLDQTGYSFSYGDPLTGDVFRSIPDGTLIDTPSPGPWRLRLDVIGERVETGETFELPYFVLVDSQGRG